MEKRELHAVIKSLRKKDLKPKAFHEDMVGVLGDDAKGAGRSQTVCAQENVDVVCDLIKKEHWLTAMGSAEITII